MVKCVVSGCPNRQGGGTRGGGGGPRGGGGSRSLPDRPPKRFFPFPKDPARVKVWLAALRETDKQDSTDVHLICEDHFLPEDVSTAGVNSDAIPIMPPYLDGPLGLTDAWGAESSEEEEQWAPGGCDEDDGGSADGAEPPSDAPQTQVHPQDPVQASEDRPEVLKSSGTQQNAAARPRGPYRTDVSLVVLTRRFLELLLAAPDRTLDLRQAVSTLKTRRRRIYDITNVLDGINLIQKESPNTVEWIGKCPISFLLWKNQQKFQTELDNLKLVEDTLDGLIKSCAQQLFDMTDDVENAALAYVTHDDVQRLRTFHEQTVIAVKAPEETKLEVPAPTEDSIQIHLKAARGPIMVLTCEVEAGHVPMTSDPAEKSSLFATLSESRIKTSTASSDP